MSLLRNKKTIFYVLGMAVLLSTLTISLPHLAANLGISTTVAGKVITIIDTFSTITTIISLVAIIVGYGVISTALVITAKKIISKYGKGYATTW
ncbi:uberolysin/carnocyclin family circular bacteriocin [Bacillus sp. AFS088145]|uniref:uberolysin/carnocyclin family circular bacteriocin n=1 Tax=Bacillus sp. AFS088145 TaxID=2033514 RepID=UPI000BF30F01|nr:uberolysin/carnocyclin family circular bacteriocin [Bacillus sp. AFS088145]PFH90595.1 circularin A/uberolysin family circular bacteriocin [Bacillus sp. AFS088145]